MVIAARQFYAHLRAYDTSKSNGWPSVVMCTAWPQEPHRPGQAKPKVLACSWLWPGLDFLKAKANGPGHGFELNILRKLLPSVFL